METRTKLSARFAEGFIATDVVVVGSFLLNAYLTFWTFLYVFFKRTKIFAFFMVSCFLVYTVYYFLLTFFCCVTVITHQGFEGRYDSVIMHFGKV